MLVRFRRFGQVIVTTVAALALGVMRGNASVAALPSLYVTYTTQCTFTMALDSGAAVVSGGTIPYGEYQVIISTPVAFAGGLGGCNFIDFNLAGPGVSYSTDLGQGDETEGFTTESFAADSTYTALDTTVAPGTTITFSTSSTPVSASPGPPSSPSSTPNEHPTPSTDNPTKQTTSTPGSNPIVNRGTLKGSVSTDGQLSLTLDGKPVTEITAGRYQVQVIDKSHTAGFTVQRASGLPTTITGVSFVGKRSVELVLSAGQWLFYPDIVGQKSYFLVAASR